MTTSTLQTAVEMLGLGNLDYVGLLKLYDDIDGRYRVHVEKAALYDKLRTAIENRILDKLHEDQIDRVTVDGRTLAATVQVVPRAADWNAIENWMYETRQWVVHHRLSSKAIVALLEEDPEAAPDGVVLDKLTKLSIRKARRAPEL